MGEKRANPLAGMASTMTDGVEMMRRMWGLTGLPQVPPLATPAGIAQFAQGLPQALPSMITPTLDIGELDKRIADLRAVEQWLNLNATMLRTSIQTLEVQRNTIATLKSFGGNVLASLNPGRETAASPGGASGMADVAAGAWPPERKRRPTAKAPAAAPPPDVPPPAPAAAPARKARARRAPETAPASAPLPINAGAWWGALQDQFARVAAAAAMPAGKASGPQSPSPPTARTTRQRPRRRPKPSTG
jgi:hypothetical protein